MILPHSITIDLDIWRLRRLYIIDTLTINLKFSQLLTHITSRCVHYVTCSKVAAFLYSCTYCKGNGHFKDKCLKLMTKNHEDHICRDYNRYERAPCEFSNEPSACLRGRYHLFIICREHGCKAYHHVFSSK